MQCVSITGPRALLPALALMLVAAAGQAEPRLPGKSSARSAGAEDTEENSGKAGASAASNQAARLFEEGRSLSAEGNFEAACPKFEQSVALSGGVGAKFNLADCYEHIGKTKSAHTLFLDVAATTRELGQDKREKAALARAAALESKMSRLSLDVRAEDSEIELMLDGEPLSSECCAKPLEVDPGSHELAARAKGKKPWSLRVDVPSGPTNVVLVVPALEAEPKATPAPKKLEVKVPKRTVKGEGPVQAHAGGSTRSTLTLVLGGVGVAGALGGGYMATRYLANQTDAKSICPESVRCTNDEIDAHAAFVDDAKLARTWMFVGIGVGSAALLGATYLFFTDESGSPSAGVTATPVVGLDGSVGGAVNGRF